MRITCILALKWPKVTAACFSQAAMTTAFTVKYIGRWETNKKHNSDGIWMIQEEYSQSRGIILKGKRFKVQ